LHNWRFLQYICNSMLKAEQIIRFIGVILVVVIW